MQGHKTIIIVDSDIDRREQLETVLSFVGEQHVCCSIESLATTFAKIEQPLTVVLTGVLDDQIVAFVKANPTCPFVLHDVVDDHSLANCINIIGQLTQPLNYAQLTEIIHHCHQYHNKLPNKSAKNSARADAFRSLVGASKAMQEVRFLIEQVAGTVANVLILGESGTGKEVIARTIHEMSTRSKAPFVPVNCGAIPGELLESELFGHEKGAFTGAISARKGRFELAEGGTLFLDEIGDMPQPMQVKLLRVLQERTFERVGGSKSIKANVRIVAATHQHLEDMIKSGDFREDLFYRLNVFPIESPALRERQDDVPLLIQELVSRFEAEQGHSVRFTEKAIESLMEHPWAGNVRELSNLIERMIIMYSDQIVNVSELPQKYQHVDVDVYQPEYPEELQEQEAIAELFAGFDYEDEDIAETETLSMNSASELPVDGLNLKEHLADLEVSLIEQALTRSEGVVARAAELLAMRRTTLVEKMRKYNIAKD